MNNYIIPEWIHQYEIEAKPFLIDIIKIQKFNNDWTFYFYSNNDTTGGLIINKTNTNTQSIYELLDYAKYKKIPLILV